MGVQISAWGFAAKWDPICTAGLRNRVPRFESRWGTPVRPDQRAVRTMVTTTEEASRNAGETPESIKRLTGRREPPNRPDTGRRRSLPAPMPPVAVHRATTCIGAPDAAARLAAVCRRSCIRSSGSRPTSSRPSSTRPGASAGSAFTHRARPGRPIDFSHPPGTSIKVAVVYNIID